MAKVVVGLMGSSVASGSTKLSAPEQLQSLLDVSKKYGVKELDTARVYNAGKGEELLGAIPEAQKTFTIATKAPGFSPGSLGYQKVVDNCNASLAALRQDHVDLYYFHGPDRQTPLEESCRAIHSLHQEGKIVQFGVSNFRSDEVEQIHSLCQAHGWITPSVYQGGYNPIERSAETALLPTLRKLGMVFYAFSPLAGGYFSRPVEQLQSPPAGGRMDQMKHFKTMYVNDLTLKLHVTLTQICANEGLSLKEATLRWLRFHSALGSEDAVILGGNSAEQMEENLKACEAGPLPKAVVDGFEGLYPQIQAAPGFRSVAP